MRRGWVMALLVGAGVSHLPLVYAVLARGDPPPVALATGLLAMGLAWAGGSAAERRREGSVRAIAALGVAGVVLPFVPALRDAIGLRVLVWPALGALLAAAALGLLARER